MDNNYFPLPISEANRQVDAARAETSREAEANRLLQDELRAAIETAIAALRPQPPLPGIEPEPALRPSTEDIYEDARWAKSMDEQAREPGGTPIPDELLMRAAVAYGMLVRRGLFAQTKDMFARSYAVAMIAHNFADDPPCTPQRTRLFSAKIGEVDDAG